MKKTMIAVAVTFLLNGTACIANAAESPEFENTDAYWLRIGDGATVRDPIDEDKDIGILNSFSAASLASSQTTNENFEKVKNSLDEIVTDINQLKEGNSSSLTVTSSDKNLSVTPTTTESGTEYKIEMNPDLKLDSATFGSGTNTSKANADGFFVGGNSMTKDGISVGQGNNKFSYDATTGDMKIGQNMTFSGSTGKIVGVTAGKVSADSTDVVNGSQLWETQQMIGQNVVDLRNMQHQINEVDKNVNKSGANSAALAALHPQDYDENHPFSAAAGVGHYHGESAVAVGMYMRPYENVTFGLGASMTGSDDAMVNLGVSYRFGGAKSVASLSQSDINRKVVALSTQNDALRAQLECANERSDRSAERVAKLSKELEAMKAQMKAIEAMLEKKN